jgi:hypothetical protein
VIEYIQECPPCKHECPPCKHECPPCPPNPCKKDTVYITNTVWKDTCIQKPTIIPPPPIIIEGCEFPYNECYPYDECMPKIQDLIQFMLSHPDTCIIMTAHTDSIGTEADNLKLSQCRADAMKELLVQAGIDEERIIPIGKGESEPIDSNSTPEGRRRNRRVEYTFFSCPKEAIEEGQGWED